MGFHTRISNLLKLNQIVNAAPQSREPHFKAHRAHGGCQVEPSRRLGSSTEQHCLEALWAGTVHTATDLTIWGTITGGSTATSPAREVPGVLSREDCEPGHSLPRLHELFPLHNPQTGETPARLYPHTRLLLWKNIPSPPAPPAPSLYLIRLSTKQRIEKPSYWAPLASDYPWTHGLVPRYGFPTEKPNPVALTFRFSYLLWVFSALPPRWDTHHWLGP